MAEDWRILEEVEMIVHDNAANMMGVYNISDFPPHCTILYYTIFGINDTYIHVTIYNMSATVTPAIQ